MDWSYLISLGDWAKVIDTSNFKNNLPQILVTLIISTRLTFFIKFTLLGKCPCPTWKPINQPCLLIVTRRFCSRPAVLGRSLCLPAIISPYNPPRPARQNCFKTMNQKNDRKRRKIIRSRRGSFDIDKYLETISLFPTYINQFCNNFYLYLSSSDFVKCLPDFYK